MTSKIISLDDLPEPPLSKHGWPWTEESSGAMQQSICSQKWPIVSIITPSYNQAQYLEETIRSILLQGYPNLEYIVIDGGSSDDSVKIIKKYETWINYWVSEPDKGQSNAINKGLSLASGQIVAWLNSDDIYLKNTLFKIVEYLLYRPFVDLVYGDALIIDEDSNIKSRLTSTSFTLEKLLFTNIIPQPSTFFRNTKLAQIGFLNEDLEYAMDYDLWLRFCGSGEIEHVDDTLSGFRIHNKSKTTNYQLEMNKESYRISKSYSFIYSSRLLISQCYSLQTNWLWNIVHLLWVQDNQYEAEKYVQQLTAILLPQHYDLIITTLSSSAWEKYEWKGNNDISDFYIKYPNLSNLRQRTHELFYQIALRHSGRIKSLINLCIILVRSHKIEYIRAMTPAIVTIFIGYRSLALFSYLKNKLHIYFG